MSKKSQKKSTHNFKLSYIFIILFVLFLILAIASHNRHDLQILEGGVEGIIQNWFGTAGAYLAKFLFYFAGIATYPIIGLITISIIRPFIPVEISERKGFLTALASVSFGLILLFAAFPQEFIKQTERLGIGHANAPNKALSGGVIGQVIAAPPDKHNKDAGVLRATIGTIGVFIVALTFLLAGLYFIWVADWQAVFVALRSKDQKQLASGKKKEKTKKEEESSTINDDEEDDDEEETDEEDAHADLAALREKALQNEEEEQDDSSADDDETTQNEEPRNDQERDGELQQTQTVSSPSPQKHKPFLGSDQFMLPPLSLLEKPIEKKGENLESISEGEAIIQATLKSFKVDGKVSNTIVGPRVTRYEISLAPGVKVEKVVSIQNNIAMELQAKSIRILAPIPGKNAVGIEVANKSASPVYLRTIMEDPIWKESDCDIPIVLGKNVAGKPIILDLAKAPHLLIAGQTGSGKSVCMNTLIMSLLFRFPPSDLRLIMVDPKVVELKVYTPLPHLISPVVNDPKKVPLALRWAVNEMERRYFILSQAGAKNLKGFNNRGPDKEVYLDKEGNPIPKKLPILVLIIDELADVMMTDAKSDVETSIARIAQKGRAAGIHIVIATQTPRKDIITGVIKANLPTRIAFSVGGVVDSRVILDQKGAESLLGKGDMLFIPPGSAISERIQGTMVSDPDIEKVVDFISDQEEQQFDMSVTTDPSAEPEIPARGALKGGIPAGGADTIDDGISPIVKKYLKPDDNDLIRQSLEIILRERKASTSYLQRRLKIGYNRAAEIIDALEDRGIVSPPLPGGSKREILVLDLLEDKK